MEPLESMRIKPRLGWRFLGPPWGWSICMEHRQGISRPVCRAKLSAHRRNSTCEVLKQEGKSLTCLRQWQKQIRVASTQPWVPKWAREACGRSHPTDDAKITLASYFLLLKTCFASCLSFYLQNGNNNTLSPSQTY